MTCPCSRIDGFDVVTRHVVMDKDLNASGHLFGGAMLAWLDEAAAAYMMQTTGWTDFVTVAMDDVNFRAPGKRGDIVTVCCRLLRTGRSSARIEARADAHDISAGTRRDIIRCHVTYVCLKSGRPWPYFESDAYRAWRERDGTPSV